MASLNDKVIRLEAKKYNKKRSKLLPTGITCKLLGKQGMTTNYDDILTVENWWYFRDTYNQNTVVRVATNDSSFVSALKVASDIQIGTEIYEIDKRDIAAPDGKHPYWEVKGIMNPERY